MRSDELREHITRELRAGAEARLKLADACLEGLLEIAEAIRASLAAGGKLLLFGNGGSAADAQHIAAEFVCRFSRDREALAAIALTTDSSIMTSISNDYGFEQIFARQIRALGRRGDVAIGISTSGSSRNVVEGMKVARAMGLTSVALTGAKGEEFARLADFALVVPSTVTSHIQEGHIVLLHTLCEAAESLLLSKFEDPKGLSTGEGAQKRTAGKTQG
jgi:D-sedoheptulose 7-phosphate isomerase